MAWKESDAVSLREEFVQLASQDGANVRELCRRYGVSPKTGYKWLRRWREEGSGGLVDRSRRPVCSPRKTCASLEEQVLEIRRAHPAWGGRKIRRRLSDLGHSPPAASTITAILHRHGCISAEDSTRSRAYGSFERPAANDLWQVDFKGEFALAGGANCFPLTILDDHSRFSLGVFACANQKRVTVQTHFREVFALYGLPRAIYVDNGNPWGTKGSSTRHTQFTVWLMRHDVQVIHGQPYYPQGRGKLERFHRTLNLETIQGRQFTGLGEVQSRFDDWRSIYNLERPHEALELATPISRYQPSLRRFQKPAAFAYSQRFETRQVGRSGQFSFGGVVYKISEAFRGEQIGLAPKIDASQWEVYYRGYRIGQLDRQSGKVSTAPADN